MYSKSHATETYNLLIQHLRLIQINDSLLYLKVAIHKYNISTDIYNFLGLNT